MPIISKPVVRGMITILALTTLACQKNEGGSSANPPNPNAVPVALSKFESQKDFGSDYSGARQAAGFKCQNWIEEVDPRIKSGLTYRFIQSGSYDGSNWGGSSAKYVQDASKDSVTVKHSSSGTGSYKGQQVTVTSSRTEVTTCKVYDEESKYKSCRSKTTDESFDINPKINFEETSGEGSCTSTTSKDEDKKWKARYEMGFVELAGGRKLPAIKKTEEYYYDRSCSNGQTHSIKNLVSEVEVGLPPLTSYGCGLVVSTDRSQVRSNGTMPQNSIEVLSEVILPAGVKFEDLLGYKEAKKDEVTPPVSEPKKETQTEPKAEEVKKDPKAESDKKSMKADEEKPSAGSDSKQKPEADKKVPKKLGPPVKKPSAESPSDPVK